MFLDHFIHSNDRYFKSDLLSEYKGYLDKFINLYWRNHVTDRNTLFSKSILANHAWLPILNSQITI